MVLDDKAASFLLQVRQAMAASSGSPVSAESIPHCFYISFLIRFFLLMSVSEMDFEVFMLSDCVIMV
jgi:hypothetical protein